MRVGHVPPGVDTAGETIIAGALEGPEPAPGSEDVFSAVDPRAFSIAGFEGKVGQTLIVPVDGASAAIIVGLGDDVSFETLRDASGNAIRKVRTKGAITLLGRVEIEGATRAVTEGSILGAYRYRSYKTGDDGETRCESLGIVDADANEMAEATILARATMMARDWVNTPAIDQSPEAYASQMAEVAEEAGVGAVIWDKGRIEEESLGALLGVAAGSERDPRVVILTYSPEAASTHLAMVGKGITFDTGGLSLKSLSFMKEMKDDMAGSAVVVAATLAIARLGLPVRVTCITPLTDNAVGGDALRPGDVLRPVAGPTIEVTNPDAEGRLILADGLGLAMRVEPDFVVDVATLTGAAKVALGTRIGAVFASDPDFESDVLLSASRAGEKFWALPLFGEYRKELDSDIADITNSTGSRYGSAIAAALFLAEYAGDRPWAHLDIAGPVRSPDTAGERVQGATGTGVRTLVELARALSEDR